MMKYIVSNGDEEIIGLLYKPKEKKDFKGVVIIGGKTRLEEQVCDIVKNVFRVDLKNCKKKMTQSNKFTLTFDSDIGTFSDALKQLKNQNYTVKSTGSLSRILR